jgi:hypothetical protein
MAWGNKPSNNDNTTPVVIDGRTGRIIDTDRDERDTDRGGRREDRGSARFIYDDHGRPTPYRDGQEW